MKYLILSLVLAAGLAAVPRPTESAALTGPAAPCGAPEFRQFDFFAGDWDTYDVDSAAKIVARNRVTIILGGCVLHEVYEGSDGLRGESYSIYDAARRVWHQTG